MSKQQNMNRLAESSKAGLAVLKNGLGKRKAEISPKKNESKKRSVLGDLTNATKNKNVAGKDVVKGTTDQPGERVMTRARSKSLLPHETNGSNETEASPSALRVSKKPNFRRSRSKSNSKVGVDLVQSSSTNGDVKRSTRSKKNVVDSTLNIHSNSSSSTGDVEESLLYTTAFSSPEFPVCDNVKTSNVKNEKNSENKSKSTVPDGVTDFDAETGNDPFQVGLYAPDIFAYYKRRELRFPMKKYLEKQNELNRNMRAILVDWMVEVQESFELNHETLYLAVKLVDLFLGKVQVKRDKLQLVGTTALYIAAKYDERCPPVIDDFCYICDDAYPQLDVIRMEQRILKVLDFDIGVPLSYRFLRRYARCGKLEMETLTLARFILETCLMDYDLIDVRDSMMACAVLLLALKMKGVQNPWTATLIHYSGYALEDIFDITHRIYNIIRNPQAHLKTIRSKYSHKVFYEVAKTTIPEELKL